MRKAALVAMVSCLLGFGPLVSAAEIGYVNLQQIKSTEEWKRLEEVFGAEVVKSQAEVQAKRKDLETAALQFERQKPMLSETARRERDKELQIQRLDLQLWTQDQQTDLERKRKEMTREIWSRVKEVVEKVARKRKLNLVIDYDPDAKDVTTNFEKGFIYLSPKVDITEEVLKEFNALFKGRT